MSLIFRLILEYFCLREPVSILMFLPFLFFLLLLHSVISDSCKKIISYNSCVMRHASDIAACNSLVVNVPTFEYWDCICQGYSKSLSCYKICPEDTNLQLQFASQRQSTFSTCDYVNEMKRQGLDAPEVKKTAKASGPDTNRTMVLPPLPNPVHSFQGNVTLEDSSGISVILNFKILIAMAILSVV